MSELELVRDLAGSVRPEAGWLLMIVRSWEGEAVPSVKELGRLAGMSEEAAGRELKGLERMGLLAGTILAVE